MCAVRVTRDQGSLGRRDAEVQTRIFTTDSRETRRYVQQWALSKRARHLELALKPFLKTIFVVALSCATFASGPEKKVAPGSKIFVEAADGFDTYLAAALQKKNVPVVVVNDRAIADYELSGVSDHQKAGWAKIVFAGQIHSDDQASVKLVDLKTSEVVFAYAVNKKNSLHGRQTAAEACAKHMKEAMLSQ
jgi:hypothetical protein